MNSKKPKEKNEFNILHLNQKYKILDINHPNKALNRRLLDMGLTKNTIITIKKIAPFGDPIDIELRGYELCLRYNDLNKIKLEVIE